MDTSLLIILSTNLKSNSHWIPIYFLLYNIQNHIHRNSKVKNLNDRIPIYFLLYNIHNLYTLISEPRYKFQILSLCYFFIIPSQHQFPHPQNSFCTGGCDHLSVLSLFQQKNIITEQCIDLVPCSCPEKYNDIDSSVSSVGLKLGRSVKHKHLIPVHCGVSAKSDWLACYGFTDFPSLYHKPLL